MPQPNDLTTLQWLAPSLVRDGLLRNESWVLPAWNEAADLFDDPALHLPARFLAILHRFALDYIRQAPALVIAATQRKQLLRREDRLEAGKRFLAHCQSGLRLAELTQAYGLAPQLRALSGLAMRGHHLDLLTALSPIPASMLAQSIPKDVGEQRDWLGSLERWRAQMARHAHDRNLFLEWAATNLRDVAARRAAGDLADFAGRNRAEFNPGWNFAQAVAASARWHEELARRPFGAAAQRADWQVVIDYAPFLPEAEIEGFVFHALQTRESIYEEGARMQHCVRMYADKVARGGSRIFSVRQGGQRIATLEVVRTSRAGANQTRYAFSQFKGPHNSRPAAPAVQAVSAFMARFCPETHAVAQGASGPLGQTRLQRAIRDIALVRVPDGGPRPPAHRHQIDAAVPGGRSRVLLRHRLGDDVYGSWLNYMEFGAFDAGVLQLSFPTRFLRNWVQAHYLDALGEACAGEFPGLARIDIAVRMPVPIDARPHAPLAAQTPSVAPASPAMPAPLPHFLASAAPIGPDDLVGSPLDERHTFDTLVAGSTNRLAHAVATQVAATSGDGSFATLNPLVIHSASGLGKTHLLQAIAHEVKRRRPETSVLYMTAERLMRAQIPGGPIDRRLEAVEVLLIDDIDLVLGAHGALMLEHLLDTRIASGRQVVLTASRPPNQLERLSERCRSRLSRGLLCGIGPLDQGLRLGLLEAKVQAKRHSDPTFALGPDVLAWMAAQDFASGREIDGIITRLGIAWHHVRQPLTLAFVQHTLRDLIDGMQPQRVRIDAIIAAVARRYAVTRADLLSQRRHPSVVRPRQIAMYLARRLTARSLPEIGRRLGGRDHTTVLHAIRRIEQLRADNVQFREEVDELARVISDDDINREGDAANELRV